jgi:hypothetical protein
MKLVGHENCHESNESKLVPKVGRKKQKSGYLPDTSDILYRYTVQLYDKDQTNGAVPSGT